MEILGQDRREGLGRKAESRAVLVTMIVASFILLLSSLYSAEASVFRKARESVIDAAEPVLSLIAGPIAYIQGVVGEVSDYFNVLEQNKALRAENAELRQWMEEALALRKTLAQYEALKAFHAPPGARPINASVIGDSNDAFTHAMLVNAGAPDGVMRGQAVIDDKGLVGRIVETGRAASRILLLTDAQSRVPVFIEDANVEGILVGRTNARPSISFTLSAGPANFQKGQRVLTSGAGGVVPRGIPVGEIVEERDGEAVVDLYADYARARLVRIIDHKFPTVEPIEAAPAEPTDRRQDGAAVLPSSVASLPALPPAPAPAPAEGAEDEPAQPEPSAVDEGD
ncbi:MAG: rod shape-determining protein MreC [Parvularculaceae bacterium]|jgi:rod shape-determining protein MreC|nr:rod shape-determining protein MreC [Parvularculaceae bacterium]